jgi:hypothetical protein
MEAQMYELEDELEELEAELQNNLQNQCPVPQSVEFRQSALAILLFVEKVQQTL